MIDVKPPAMDRSGHALLREMLRQRNQSPERVEEIDRAILATFERRLAVLVLDMCGFSRLTTKHGALFYLSMIVQMEEAATPAVLNNGGRVIKQEADNFFAVFDAPTHALEAALDIFVAFRAMNSVVPDDRDITASVGIGFGDLLDTGDDVFGDEMNAACRLGEDLACKEEILLTPAAAEAVRDRKQFEIERIQYNSSDGPGLGGGPVVGFRYVGRRVGAAGP